MKPSERRAARAERAEARKQDAAPQAATRAWFVAGFLHLALAALLGAMRATQVRTYPDELHVLVATSGAVLVAGGLAYGFAPPFLKRSLLAPGLSTLPLAALLAGEAAALLAPVVGRGALAMPLVGTGIAYILLPLHLGASALAGPEWRGGVALFAKDQPYRRGDAAAAAAFGTSMLGLAAGGAMLLLGQLEAGVALALLTGALPFFLGVLVFLLPRNAKEPMPGTLIVLASLGIGALSTAALAAAFATGGATGYRFPAAGVVVAIVLAAVALLHIRFPVKTGPQLDRSRPFLNASVVFAAFAAITLPLATLRDAPNNLLPVTTYLHLLLAGTLAAATSLLGAPILLNAVPRPGRWAPWTAALAILSIFLIAPAFQYPRPAFPGAAVLLLATLLLLWGLAPMRRPRREC